MKDEQSIPNGTKCKINWKGDALELAEEGDQSGDWYWKMNNTVAVAESAEFINGLDKDSQYYNVRFPDGVKLIGISGYYLTPISEPETLVLVYVHPITGELNIEDTELPNEDLQQEIADMIEDHRKQGTHAIILTEEQVQEFMKQQGIPIIT